MRSYTYTCMLLRYLNYVLLDTTEENEHNYIFRTQKQRDFTENDIVYNFVENTTAPLLITRLTQLVRGTQMGRTLVYKRKSVI